MPQMPSLLPPAQNMASYYNTRSQVPSTTDYYASLPSTAPQMPMATTLASSYEPYAVAPLTMQPPTHTPHYSYHGSTSSYLHNDVHARVPPALPTQHRASSGAWNQNDDETLKSARASGLNWDQIRKHHFPNKTSNACRKRHERLMERRGADDWDNRKMEQIAKAYMSLRKEIWAPLAQRTGEKWNVIEQKCMSNGLKNLQAASRAAARRERLEVGLPPHDPYNDDSGISGIDGMDPCDDMNPDERFGGVSSPDRRSTSSGDHTSSTASQSYATPAYGHTSYVFPSLGGHIHTYPSSVSSSSGGTAGYGHSNGHDSHSQSASPYMDPVSRMPSVDMGIDAIINRPGGHVGGPVQ